MKSTKYTKLKGFRDFLPQDKLLRDYVEDNLKDTFLRFNFKPIETPTIEYSELLLGKYGDEADKLVYKFKDNGDRDVALRYDQTVPTARFIVENQNDLPKFFRRYQIQNVYRSEKPQVGRYREFKQCDIDIFGTINPIADAEVLACVYASFINLGITDFKILINDRDLLVKTISQNNDSNVNVFSIIQTIDKQDKISKEEVLLELTNKGLKPETATKIWSAIQDLKGKVPDNLKEIMDLACSLGVPKDSLVFQPFLARGLDYYTGMIFEVKSKDFKEGSLGGGGRYDNLIEQLVGKNIPAVGFAFGFDRILELLKRNSIQIEHPASYLMCLFNDESKNYALKAVVKLRNKLNVEVYPNSTDSLSNQLKYAITNNFNYVLLAGINEMKKNVVIIKNLATKEQKELII